MKTCMIGMYVFMLSSLLISRKAVEISYTRGKLYACTRRFGLCFMSRTNKAVATRWLATTTTTTKSCDQHLLYYHPTILFSPFPRAYKAKLTARPLMIQMMRFKFQGGVRPGVYQNRSHHFQEEDEMMARACVLAFCLLSGWKKIEVEIGNIHNLNFNNCVII